MPKKVEGVTAKFFVPGDRFRTVSEDGTIGHEFLMSPLPKDDFLVTTTKMTWAAAIPSQELDRLRPMAGVISEIESFWVVMKGLRTIENLTITGYYIATPERLKQVALDHLDRNRFRFVRRSHLEDPSLYDFGSYKQEKRDFMRRLFRKVIKDHDLTSQLPFKFRKLSDIWRFLRNLRILSFDSEI